MTKRIFTKQGARDDIEYMFAYSGGVFVFPFEGTTSYTDPHDSSVWVWDGVSSVSPYDEVLGVTEGNRALFAVESVSDCVDLEGSFYWDDTNGYLYVRWYDSVNDYTVGRDRVTLSAIEAGYSSGIHSTSKNFFDGVYYKPIITALSGLSRTVDPTKLGLLAFKDSSYELTDEADDFINEAASNVTGVPVWFYYSDSTTLDDDDRIFTAFLNGFKHNRSSISFNLVEQRLFDNKPVCPNTIDVADFPNVGDLDGDLIPVAWGDVRRGKMLLTNYDSLTTAGTETATFLVADPAIGAVTAITKVYDSEDNEITIDSSSVTTCLVSITKTAGVSVSELKKYKWEGRGYAISGGTYNNGIDIIQHAFNALTSTPYISSTYNLVEWAAAKSANTQAVGISLQSDKGFTEELIQPICTSLQGFVTTDGRGRITFVSRDITADPKRVITIQEQLDDPEISIDPDSTVSELLIEYAPDFVAKDSLKYVYNEDSETTIKDYGIDRRDPLSPVKTVLYDSDDIADLSVELLSTSSSPEKIITVSTVSIYDDIQEFDIIGIDIGTLSTSSIIWGEILSIKPDYINKQSSIMIRVIPDYAPSAYVDGFPFGDHAFGDIAFGGPEGFIY